ncbi:MAG: hypothetical protein DMF56_24270 [Acidobacteria bacterium]|nr:MAG: hypothetical protein DMF56_24270 [Acidobacteriota bacterium]
MVTVLFASLLVNGLVIFLVARPARALVLLIFYVGSVAGLIAASSASQSDGLFFTALVAVILGPMCISAVEYYWHAKYLADAPIVASRWAASQSSLDQLPDSSDKATAFVQPAPQFLGTADMERLRNEIEIAIFHHTDRLAFLAAFSYFVASLCAGVALLENNWVSLSCSFILSGLAYSAKTHESRVFALLYVALAAGIFANAVRNSVLGVDDGSSWQIAFAIFVLGLGTTATTVALARLRRIRRRIPLKPAEHLRD